MQDAIATFPSKIISREYFFLVQTLILLDVRQHSMSLVKINARYFLALWKMYLLKGKHKGIVSKSN